MKRLNILMLKIIAALTMLIDHIGSFHPIQGWEYMRMIGRVSFPLYAFMLVQGFIYTRSRWKYLVRLLALAFLTQPIYTWCFYGDAWKWDSLNILFTLSAGLCGMWLISLGKQVAQKRNTAWWLYCIGLCVAVSGIALLAEPWGMDYGCYGVLLMLLLYVTAGCKWAWIPIIVLFSLRNQLATGAWNEPVYQRSIFSVVALLPMLLYNGAPGPKPQSKWGAVLYKYGFYAFYPLHLVVLALIFQ